ncbi:Outer membrane protein TolC [Balnearium lithotrophicum]|uniref:Outer membrane protein TolC n=1 Tax=Balnearium lithotrophicum TaxID=223788 RepID=A0A521DER2_9BACT|nr:TolC family protein [Balnearium lithotrophicum]SMO70227.1 Outer membrane protein TolC [Balnearium lithotrophicum]
MRKLIVLLILLLPVNSLGSELSYLLEKALKDNKEIKKARSEYRISDLLYKEAVSDYFPKVNLFYSRTKLSEVPEFPIPGVPNLSIPFFNDSYYQFGVNLKQPLFMGGRILYNVRLKNEQKKASYYLFKETINKVIYEVKSDYFNVLKAKANVEAAKVYLRSAKKHFSDVKAFFDEGIVPRRDLLEAEVKLRDAEEKLTLAEAIYKVALEKLKTDVGDTNLEFEPSNNLTYRKINLNLNELLKIAYSERPLIKYVKLLKRSSNEGVRLAVSQFLPQTLLNLSYQKTDQYPGDVYSSFSVSFQLNFPIFQGGSRFFEVERAREERRKSEDILKQTRDNVRLQVVSAYTELQSALSRIKTAESMVKEAKELLRDSRERYREHVGTATEVTDAIAYLYNAKKALNSALADYNTALSKLEYAVGKPLTGDENE